MQKVIMDFGQNSAMLFNATTNTIWTLKDKADILDLPNSLVSGTRLIVENAHMGVPKRKYSKAQWFTAEELLSFYKLCADKNVVLLLFPEQQTNRARNYAGLDKNDENDLRAIHKFTEECTVSYRKPPTTFEPDPVREEGYVFKAETNNILNITRGLGGDGYFLDDNMLSQFLIENLNTICENLSDDTKTAFRLTDSSKYKIGDRAGQFNLQKVCFSQIYSVASTLMAYDGTMRIRNSTGELPGWGFVKKHILCMSPHHLRGGVARSNLYYHGMRHYIANQMDCDEISRKEVLKKKRGRKRDANNIIVPDSDFTKEQEQQFLSHRSKYARSIKELFVVIKDTIQNSKSQLV